MQIKIDGVGEGALVEIKEDTDYLITLKMSGDPDSWLVLAENTVKGLEHSFPGRTFVVILLDDAADMSLYEINKTKSKAEKLTNILGSVPFTGTPFRG